MATSWSRGHKTYWNELTQQWYYCDTNEIDDGNRPCKRCGRMPTLEGYDACLGYIKNVSSACCGHGTIEPYIIINK
jgi:hypothetical protein